MIKNSFTIEHQVFLYEHLMLYRESLINLESAGYCLVRYLLIKLKIY